jgi:hypothetical protein
MPDGDTSSADPRALAAYTEAGLNIDAQLDASANRLAGALAEFAATCREYPLGIDATLAEPLRNLARRTVDDDLWVRRVGEQFALADRSAIPRVDTSGSSDDLVAATVGPPIPIDPNTVQIDPDELEQFLTPDFDLSASQTNPWAVAFQTLKLFLKAAGDSPAECNDAFWQMALAAKDGPKAVEEALRSRPGCNQSRALVRVTIVLADGTPVDLQQEMMLDEFARQMTAVADGLGGGASRPRTLTREQGQANVAKGWAFENVLDSVLRRLQKFPFFRPKARRGFDLVTLEDGVVVLNETLVGYEGGSVVINEAKFQNKLQYADFKPITSLFRYNIQRVLDSLSGSANLSAAEKAFIRTTLEGYLRDGASANLRVRVITGKASIGPGLRAKVSAANGLPLEVVDVKELLGVGDTVLPDALPPVTG